MAHVGWLCGSRVVPPHRQQRRRKRELQLMTELLPRLRNSAALGLTAVARRVAQQPVSSPPHAASVESHLETLAPKATIPETSKSRPLPAGWTEDQIRARLSTF